jgi:hypothetical protein
LSYLHSASSALQASCGSFVTFGLDIFEEALLGCQRLACFAQLFLRRRHVIVKPSLVRVKRVARVLGLRLRCRRVRIELGALSV